MLRWASLFFLIALAAGALGLGGRVDSLAVWGVFYGFLVLFVLALVLHLMRKA